MVFSFRSLNYKLHIQALKLYKYIRWHMRQMCLHRHILLLLTAASVDINMLLLASAFIGTFYLAFHPYSDPAISRPLHPRHLMRDWGHVGLVDCGHIESVDR